MLSSVLLTDDASVERVAALFSMHSRTFNRRLAAYGTCFKELADESRFELARQMLEESSYAVGDAADTLGYADASAFIRAFVAGPEQRPRSGGHGAQRELAVAERYATAAAATGAHCGSD